MKLANVPDSLRQTIRPSIRAQKPYLVPGSKAQPATKLNQNESPFDLPEAIKKELVDVFLKTPFNRYPKEHPYQLINALAEELGHPTEGILVGNGSNELTYTLGMCLIAPDTPVVLPTPMFSLYTSVVKMFAGNLIAVPPLPSLHFDMDAIATAVETHQPALTVLTTPNNPTGLAIALPEIRRIAELANGFVLVDEAYVEFTAEESAFSLLETFPNVILMRTFSKAYGLAGLRIGYLIGHPEIIGEFMKSRLPFMIDKLSESIALTLLKRRDMIAERIAFMQTSCMEMTTAMQAMPGVDVIPSQTNFVIFKTQQAPGALMQKLIESGVLVRNMMGYPELAGYLRVNAGSAEENKAFLRALEDAL
ncbi:MAG: histidinol-phosphate transaminase [Bacteroidota bacterium]